MGGKINRKQTIGIATQEDGEARRPVSDKNYSKKTKKNKTKRACKR